MTIQRMELQAAEIAPGLYVRLVALQDNTGTTFSLAICCGTDPIDTTVKMFDAIMPAAGEFNLIATCSSTRFTVNPLPGATGHMAYRIEFLNTQGETIHSVRVTEDVWSEIWSTRISVALSETVF